MNEQQLRVLTLAQEYVTDLFQRKVDQHFTYHNLEHVQQVVAGAEEMAGYYKLSDSDRLVLLLSAWFHDAGFSSGRAEDHEKESVRLATEFLQEQNVDADIIQRVSSCIRATRMPQSPLSQVEKLMCDADLFHLGSDDFKKRSDRLKKEQEYYLRKEIPNREWRQRNIEFLESHEYFSDYAQQHREPKKQEWIKLLRKKQGNKEVKHKDVMEVSPYSFAPGATAKAKAADKAEDKDRERGIQTMFRMTASNHIHLSSQADSKAHIMISVNSIIISIMFSVLLGRLEYYPHLAIPTMLLALVCLLTIVFSVLATRPSINKGKFTEDDIRNKKTNLLFFGNFHQMQLEEYTWAMSELMKDSDYVYGSMIKDNYFLGIVLARKYHYLRISYNIFMYGLILAVLAFGVAYYIGGT